MRRSKRAAQLPFIALGQAEVPPVPEKKSFLTTVLIPIGAVLVAALGLLVQAVPWWVTTIIVSYVLVAALVGMVPVTIRVYRYFQGLMTYRAVARRNTPLVHRFVITLIPNLEESRPDTVFNVWKSASLLDQGRGLVRPDYLHLRTLQSWLRSIDGSLEVSCKNSFDQLCDDLAEVVLQYSRFCEQAHREIEALILNSKPEEHNIRNIKQEWNNARDKHNQTIKAWEDLAKNINHDAGERICFDSCRFLKTIG